MAPALKRSQIRGPLTLAQLYKAGARLARTGDYTPAQAEAWAVQQGCSPLGVNAVVQGCKDERANGRQGKGRLGR